MTWSTSAARPRRRVRSVPGVLPSSWPPPAAGFDRRRPARQRRRGATGPRRARPPRRDPRRARRAVRVAAPRPHPAAGPRAAGPAGPRGSGTRPRRGRRPARGPPRARGRGGGWSPPLPRRAARGRRDDARRAAAGSPPRGSTTPRPWRSRPSRRSSASSGRGPRSNADRRSSPHATEPPRWRSSVEAPPACCPGRSRRPATACCSWTRRRSSSPRSSRRCASRSSPVRSSCRGRRRGTASRAGSSWYWPRTRVRAGSATARACAVAARRSGCRSTRAGSGARPRPGRHPGVRAGAVEGRAARRGGESSAEVAARVTTARERQADRWAGTTWRLNGHVPGRSCVAVDCACPIPSSSLGTALDRGLLTMRGYDRCLRLALDPLRPSRRRSAHRRRRRQRPGRCASRTSEWPREPPPHSLSGVSRVERGARAAWSRIAEPADERALALVAEHGAVDAFRLVTSGHSGVPEVFRMRIDRFGVDRDPVAQLGAARAIGATVLCPGDPDWPRAWTTIRSRRSASGCSVTPISRLWPSARSRSSALGAAPPMAMPWPPGSARG